MSAAASLGPSSAPSLTPRQLAALPAAPTPASAGASAALYIQVGAFAASDHAQHAVQRLRAAGVRDAFMLGPDLRHTLLRVRIGPIASVQQYDALIGQLRSLGFAGARLAQD
jgi:rare lipoprotein A